VEIVKTGSLLTIAPVEVDVKEDSMGCGPDDPIWNLARNPILADPLTEGSSRHDEIIYQGR
jgi:hypothetical protein